MENLIIAWNVLKVVLGIGFVIFIHELGHFLLAKWNGVKVERFSIGFGPTLASYRKGVGLRVGTGSRAPGPNDPPTIGETEYVLAALPLGGYVKMLGESIEEQTEEAPKLADPRAFHNKTVGARMAIITAGVIMNLILGFVFFSIVHTQPSTEISSKVGGVVAGSPAESAGILAGDEVVAIDDQPVMMFRQIPQQVALSASGQKLRFRVKRGEPARELTIEVEPKREDGSAVPTVGLVNMSSLELAEVDPYIAPPGLTFDAGAKPVDFKEADRVVAVGPASGALEPVKNHREYVARLDRLRDQPVTIEVERRPAGKDGKPDPLGTPTRVRSTIPPHRAYEFGFRLEGGPVEGIVPGSPAAKAGIKPGDKIVAVDGDADFDPMKLPEMARAHAGQPWKITVDRAKKPDSPQVKTEDLVVTPDDAPVGTDAAIGSGRLQVIGIPGIGLAMSVGSKVAAVEPDSAASKAGIKAGDVLQSLTITPKKVSENSRTKPVTIGDQANGFGWPIALPALQEVPWEKIQVKVVGKDTPVEIAPTLAEGKYLPMRGLRLVPETREVPPADLATSLRLGAADTWDNVTGIYKILRGLAQKRVGSETIGGILPIASAAYMSASGGLVTFLHFMAFLSVQLAVLNFLPIPPLDGGQFLFLAAEKVRGKPLPESALNAVTTAGILFVLMLIVLINGRDVFRFIQGYF